MAVRTVGMHEAKTQLSKLVRELEQGDEIIVTRSGKPVARLLPPEPGRSFTELRGAYAGKMWLADETDEDRAEMARLFGTAD